MGSSSARPTPRGEADRLGSGLPCRPRRAESMRVLELLVNLDATCAEAGFATPATRTDEPFCRGLLGAAAVPVEIAAQPELLRGVRRIVTANRCHAVLLRVRCRARSAARWRPRAAHTCVASDRVAELSMQPANQLDDVWRGGRRGGGDAWDRRGQRRCAGCALRQRRDGRTGGRGGPAAPGFDTRAEGVGSGPVPESALNSAATPSRSAEGSATGTAGPFLNGSSFDVGGGVSPFRRRPLPLLPREDPAA
jgi:hypothetical protein